MDRPLSLKPIISLPDSIARDEIIEVRTLMPHRMETGLRVDPDTGSVIPRQIVHQFVASFNGREVFRTRLHPAIAANPFISFFVRAGQSGQLLLEWTDDAGNVTRVRRKIDVSG